MWSWILTAVGVFSIYLIGSRVRAGFVVGVLAQALWIIYAVTTKQYGFVVASLLYASMYARGWLRWTPDEAKSE